MNNNPGFDDKTENKNEHEYNNNTEKSEERTKMDTAPGIQVKTETRAAFIPEIEKRDRSFVWIFYGLLFLLFNFAFEEGLRLGFFIFVFLFIVFTGVYLGKGRHIGAFTLFCGASSVIAAASFAIWASPASKFFGLCGIALLAVLYLAGISGALRWGSGGYRLIFDALRVVFVYPFASISAAFRALKADKDENTRKSAGPAIWGLIASLPALAVIIPLLMDSDLAFNNLLSMAWDDIGTTMLHLVLAFGFLPLALSLMLSLRKGLLRKNAKERENSGFSPAFICGFFGMISVIYLVYLFSQLSYFFSGFLGVLPDGYGFTAAEYARRGFFELAAVSVINLLLLFGASVFSKKVKGNVSPVLRVFGIFICAFNLVLAGTSISKMFLYINRFGLTRLRLYTSVFMLMMVFVIITVILRYLFRAFPYMRISIIACTLAGLCVLLCDADAAVARYNVNAYLEERLDSIDVYTIYELSDSAVVYLEKLYDEAKDVNVKQSAARAIVNLYDGRAVKDDNGRVISLGDKDFRSFTLTEYRANKILQSRYEECKSNMGDVKTRYSYRDSR